MRVAVRAGVRVADRVGVRVAVRVTVLDKRIQASMVSEKRTSVRFLVSETRSSKTKCRYKTIRSHHSLSVSG
mgnify:CR=1 FL=1